MSSQYPAHVTWQPDRRRTTQDPAAQDLLGAVITILMSCLPGQAKAPRSAIDVVIGARIRPAAPQSAKASSTYNAALAWSWLHSGHPAEAVQLADRDIMSGLQRLARHAPASTVSAAYAILAEVYLLNGRLRDSVACGRFAKDYALEAADAGCQYRALGLLTSSLALSGETTAAAQAAAEAVALDGEQGWAQEQSSWPLLLGLVLVLARAGDAESVQEHCGTLAQSCGDDVVARAVSRYANVVLQTVRQDNQQIVAAARIIAQGSDASLTPPFLVDLALYMESIAHVHLGDPGTALAVIGNRVSPPDHAVCFELGKATAYLQLGEFREALRVTEWCVKDHPDHNLGRLASVQLRRALAYEGLGIPARADAEYSKSAHLAFEIGAVAAAIGLPLPILKVLHGRLVANEPMFGRQLDKYLPEDYTYPDRAPLDFAPVQLTSREKVLAGWLITDLSLAAIAAQLQVSTNTVKSQLRTLYKKLEVSSRAEAVLQLERGGLVSRSDGPASPG